MITNDTSGDSGRLQAFDAADNLLGTDSRFRSGFGTAQTLTVGTATPLISYVIADAPSTDSLSFDNLVTSGDLADFYRLELSEADQIEAVTSTPGEGPNEPVNALDPRLTLVGPDGFVVAFDDNSADNVRNARFVYTVPVGGAGTHTLQLDGTGVGPCTILANRTGDPIAASAPTVVLAVPTDGTGVGTAPTTLRLGFSEGMRADSFDATDLVFADAGVSVNSVTQIDGDTVEFGVTVPDVEAVYDYTLTGGSATDLQGTGNAEFTGSFFIDRDGPQVVSTSPANQASAPFSEITFTFDENVDPASVDLSDAFNFAGPGGSITPGGVSVLGPDVIFTFPAQTTEGVYTFEIGPGITDVAGNLMDQDGNGTGGKVTDRFAVGLNLASPDLRPDDISPLAAAQFGATITVDYTARNVGTDSAANQWVDRICLSTDNVLGANDSYTRSEQGTIPLDATSQAGSYFVIVEVDADNQQAESIETNNTTLEPISLTLPPLPDLIVTDIVAPIESLSGQDIQIFWTLANQGTGDFSGSFNERLFLSADAFFSGNDQLFGTFDFTGNLPQGQSVNRTQTISLPDTLQGDRFVIIQTDSGAAVFEGQAGEQNNVTADDAAIQVSLRPFPNLQVTNMSPPAAAFSGQQIVIEWQVDNTGDGPTDVPTWNDGVFLSVDTRVLRTAHHRGVDRGQQRPDPDGRGLLA
jgi:hypothetical protein